MARRKKDSFRRWLARARLGQRIPREAIEEHPRLLDRFPIRSLNGVPRIEFDDYTQTMRVVPIAELLVRGPQ